MGDFLAVFDLDGTLHHTEKALLPAIRMALGDVGVTGIDDARINSLYGEPLEVFATELLGGRGADVDAFRDGIRRYQRLTLPEHGALYPGTEDLLAEAVSAGWTLAVLSNAGLDYIDLVTETLGIGRYFTHLCGRTGGGAAKTSRLTGLMTLSGCALAVMAGDRYHDILAAREARIPSIGCAYGYGASSELSRADHVVGSVAEIGPILAALRGSPGDAPRGA